MKKERKYCVMGTSVRTGKRHEITNEHVFINHKEALVLKTILNQVFRDSKNKEYTFKNLRIKQKS